MRDGKRRILSAAATLARFAEGRPLSDGYSNVFDSYETLLDIIGRSHTTREISRILNMPDDEIERYAGQIIDLLLFNRENDPYLSLGLPRCATAGEVGRRWKALMLLYHPDKYPDRRCYEERAKKINEAYERIRSAKRHALPVELPVSDKKKKAASGAGSKDIRHFRSLRYLPGIILALVVMTAVISVLIFIGTLRHNDADSPREAPAVSIIR